MRPQSWYFFMVETGKSYSISNGDLPGAGEKLDQRVWSTTWRGDPLVAPPMSQTWGLLNTLLSPVPSLALYFNHLHYKCPQKGPATFHPCSYLHPVPFTSCLGFFSSILLERDLQGYLWPCEWTSRSTPDPILSHQPPRLCNPELFVFKASSYFLVFTYAVPSARKICPPLVLTNQHHALRFSSSTPSTRKPSLRSWSRLQASPSFSPMTWAHLCSATFLDYHCFPSHLQVPGGQDVFHR